MVQYLAVPVPHVGPKVVRVLTYREMAGNFFVGLRWALEHPNAPPQRFRTIRYVEPNVWS